MQSTNYEKKSRPNRERRSYEDRKAKRSRKARVRSPKYDLAYGSEV